MEPDLVVVGEPELIEVGGLEFWEIFSGATVPITRRIPARSSFVERRVRDDHTFLSYHAERRRLIVQIGLGLSILDSHLGALRGIGEKSEDS